MNTSIIDLQIKNGRIWDIIRKKWLIVQPEEIVRQQIILYLINIKKYPASLIAVEKEFQYNNLLKRFDILVYDNKIMPHILVECKRQNVKLTNKNLNQILTYNLSLNPKYIIISNGLKTLFFERLQNNAIEIRDIPNYNEI